MRKTTASVRGTAAATTMPTRRAAALDPPDAGPLAVVEYRPERHFDRTLARFGGDPKGHRRTERRRCGLAFERIARLVGAATDVGGVRQLPQTRGVAPAIAEQGGFGRRADRRPDGLGQRDDRFAGAGLGDPDHRLAGGDNLARLAKRLDHRSIRVRQQGRVGRLVLCDPRVGLRGGELRLGRVQRCLHLLVALSGDPSIASQLGVAPFVRDQLHDRGARGNDGIALRRDRKAKVGLIDPHQRLPCRDPFAVIHETLDDLARHAEAELALDPGADDAGEAAFGPGDTHRRRQPDQGRRLPRVAHRRCLLREPGKGKSDRAAHGEHDDSRCHESLRVHGGPLQSGVVRGRRGAGCLSSGSVDARFRLQTRAGL